MTMHWLETRIPPPLVFLSCLAINAGGARLWPGLAATPSTGSRLLVWALLVCGACLGAAAVAQFLSVRTTVHPTHPERTTALVTTGIYRITRNPMYLGLAIFLLAYGVHLMHPAGVLALVVFVAYITRFQILPEERALAAAFGTGYDDYRARVRRWL